MSYYLSLDVETGGIGLDKSLLSLGLVFCDNKLDVVERKHILLKPNDEIFKVTGESLSINKIDLSKHYKEALTYKLAATNLYSDLFRWSGGGANKLVVIGKQVAGDVRFIQEYLLSKNTWEQFCSYRLLDVSSVFMFLRAKGIYKEDMKGSLSDLLDYYQIDKSNQHDALFDAEATVAVLRKMFDEVKWNI